MEKIVFMIKKVISSGNSIYICGNGGFASMSEHFSSELQKSLYNKRDISLELSEKIRILSKLNGIEDFSKKMENGFPVSSLASNLSTITAIGNDISFDMIFAQQIFNKAKEGDLIILLSSSGVSRNIINSAIISHIMKLKIILITGNNEIGYRDIVDYIYRINSDKCHIIQQKTLGLMHKICLKIQNYK